MNFSYVFSYIGLIGLATTSGKWIEPVSGGQSVIWFLDSCSIWLRTLCADFRIFRVIEHGGSEFLVESTTAKMLEFLCKSDL